MQEKLQDTIEQTLKKLKEATDWQIKYEMQADILLNNREILEQFYKATKDYEKLQFYIIDIIPPDLFTISTKYIGTDIATITIFNDKMTISTNTYDKSNEEAFDCKIQLQDTILNTQEAKEFLEYFQGDIPSQTKECTKADNISMLLSEFSKTSSYNKILTGIQPIKYRNIYIPIPTIDTKAPIDILTRTKVRKITIIEVAEENQDLNTILAEATTKAVFLKELLHSNIGDKWYKIMGFHGRNPSIHTLKAVIAVNKKYALKFKEFEPYEISIGAGTIQYHYLQYEIDKNSKEITNIKTTLNS